VDAWNHPFRGVQRCNQSATNTPDSLRYYDFASGQIRDVLKLQKDFSDGLSISPDGRYLLYSQLDDLNSDIMVVENYR